MATKPPIMPQQSYQSLLAAFAVLVRNQLKISDAGLQVVRLLQASGRRWPELLDRRYGLRSDQLDDALRNHATTNSHSLPPSGWPHLDYPASRHWDCARIILHCLAYISAIMLAEAALIANLPWPDAAQLTRIEVLAREAWRQRMVSRNPTTTPMESD